MLRLIACGLLATALAGAARASELDREAGSAPAGPAKPGPAAVAGGSELDNESPAQSHYWRRGWYGGPYWWGGYAPVGPTWGWGGYARVGLGWGWGGYYRPWGWGYYPGFYAYPGWYGGFYPAAYWGGGWGWW